MIADEEDRAVARLRDELDGVRLASSPDHVDRVLRHVHGRRRAQRQQRVQMLTAVAVVVFAVAGAFVVTSRDGEGPEKSNTVAAVTQWQLRGDLAGNVDLVKRAEQTWKASAYAPAAPVRAVFAGRSPNISVCFDLIVLVADAAGSTEQVAFVTTPISVTGKPDQTRLVLRAVTTVPAGQQAVGFLSTTRVPEDEHVSSNGAIGVALTAPGLAEIEVRTPLVLDQARQTNIPAGVVWPAPEQGTGAWNAELVLRTPGDHKQRFAIAAGIGDPVVDHVSLRSGNGTVRASGAGIRPGDIIATPEGIIGVVSAADGTVDTRLTTIGALGKVQTSTSAIPGRLVDGTSGVVFEPTADGLISEGNRLQVLAWNRPELAFDIGTLHQGDQGWRTERVPGVVAATSALRIGGK
ncbi:hypothetical protein [Actinokineospora globicatena]|uniref:hypothetical protein n=1 Tax=Actinokineospora globicatena TaxID=103729 RepID=UPI0020A5D730|nr:hypothetical protein [Actinokineospora globicatena]GLW76561.1 hypothetical protein Aglo01_10430 [Actinokineospora globicatena]GLW83395.1 hypothetical protein Aglo02_10350 [Actinokineospora globicatena]